MNSKGFSGGIVKPYTLLSKDSSFLIGRRRFLGVCASSMAALALPSLPGCGDDLRPGDPWKLWIAQTLRGKVTTLIPSGLAVPGTEVTFRCGLKLNEYALFGIATTGSSGDYYMLAEDHPGADAGYWRFIIDDSHFQNSDDDVPVYCQFEFKKTGFSPKVYQKILWRKPQKSLPPTSESFHLVQHALLSG